jgi:hypothetical protein
MCSLLKNISDRLIGMHWLCHLCFLIGKTWIRLPLHCMSRTSSDLNRKWLLPGSCFPKLFGGFPGSAVIRTDKRLACEMPKNLIFRRVDCGSCHPTHFLVSSSNLCLTVVRPDIQRLANFFVCPSCSSVSVATRLQLGDREPFDSRGGGGAERLFSFPDQLLSPPSLILD